MLISVSSASLVAEIEPLLFLVSFLLPVSLPLRCLLSSSSWVCGSKRNVQQTQATLTTEVRTHHLPRNLYTCCSQVLNEPMFLSFTVYGSSSLQLTLYSQEASEVPGLADSCRELLPISVVISG